MLSLRFAAIVLAALSTALVEGKPATFPKGALPEGKLSEEVLKELETLDEQLQSSYSGDENHADGMKVTDKQMMQACKDYSKISTQSWKHDVTQHENMRAQHDRRQRALLSAEGKRMIQQHWPKLSKKGYKVFQAHVLAESAQMQVSRHRNCFMLEEFIPEVVHQSPTGSEGRVKFLPLPTDYTKEDNVVDTQLRPLVEKFVKQDEVKFVSVYGGIRMYEAGSSLQMHLSSPDKVISVIYALSYTGDGEHWPLKIHRVEADASTAKSVTLKAGEALVYEGGRMVVGRPDPLSSGSATFIYAHYAPQDDIVDVQELSQHVDELMSSKPSQEEL